MFPHISELPPRSPDEILESMNKVQIDKCTDLYLSVLGAELSVSLAKQADEVSRRNLQIANIALWISIISLMISIISLMISIFYWSFHFCTGVVIPIFLVFKDGITKFFLESPCDWNGVFSFCVFWKIGEIILIVWFHLSDGRWLHLKPSCKFCSI